MPRKQKDIHYIYKTTNLINNKYYIGLHSTNNLEDGYLGSGLKLRRSIRKYGKQNFKKEILEFCNNLEHLKQREKEIVDLDLLQDKLCMNLMLGGQGGNFSGERNTFYGKHHTEEHKKYISEYIKNWCKENPDIIAEAKIKRAETFKKIDFNFSTFKNKQHSEESKLKMRGKNKSGDKNSQFGTCWITNGTENKKIKNTDMIPQGYYKGRKCSDGVIG